jgi:hypothetical protein
VLLAHLVQALHDKGHKVIGDSRKWLVQDQEQVGLVLGPLVDEFK